MNRNKELKELLFQFIKFGLFTFGGGWSIIAQMQQIYVEKKKTITSEELLDITSVARSIPGTMIGNVAMLFGYSQQGVLGGIVCLFGMILPPMLVIIGITLCYTAFRENVWVAAGMMGVRSAVVPIIISAAFGLVKGAFKYKICIAVCAVSAALYLFLGISPIYLVIFGIVCGLCIGEYQTRMEAKQ